MVGPFWPQRTSDINSVEWSAEDEGRILYDFDNKHFYYGTSTGWVRITDTDDLFSIGSELIFASILPTGWNIRTGVDDRVLSLTNSSTKIGQHEGSWVITGMNYAGSHNHFTPSMLGGPTVTGNVGIGLYNYITVAGSSHSHTFAYEGNHVHTFDGSWRPSYVKLVIGIYQG